MATPLRIATIHRDPDVIRVLAAAGADANIVGQYGTPLLHFACANEDVETVQALIRAGSNVNSVGESNITPLHIVCTQGHVKTTKALLKAGANVTRRMEDGLTALHIAVFPPNVELVKSLLSDESGKAATSVADKFGVTPLHLASIARDQDVIQLLLANGANVNAVDADGFTPMDYALYAGRSTVTDLLSAVGVTTNKHDASKRGDLLYAAYKNGKSDIAIKCLLAGANWDDATAHRSDADRWRLFFLPQFCHHTAAAAGSPHVLRDAKEQDAFLSAPRRDSSSSSKHLATWGKLALGAALGVAGIAYCVSVQSSLQAQHATIALMQQQIEAMHSVVVQSAATQARETISNSAHYAASTKFPSKFSVKHVTPLKTQDNRGTCWDFATIGPLEQSYRAQGIRHGWLKHDEYVAFSEQAYGAEVLRLCSGPPGSPQQVACLIPGNQIWENSTEGGESAELYYLMNGLKDSVFPDSLCPYIPDDGNDTLCTSLTPQKRATNPLKLTLRKMDTLYEEVSVKKALLHDQRAMAFTTSMPYITYYYPCVGAFVNDTRCNPASPSCTLCPADMPHTTCCIPVHGKENYNMEGEFITSKGMLPEGGHVMTLVGYNDLYRTQQGYTGGFILKNSWWDGVHPKLGPTHARGSHTIKWWMQEVSDWEERSMCPNSHNPENWYQCGDFGEVIERNADSGLRVPLPLTKSGVFQEGIESCLSEETQLYAKTNLQPLHLRCTNPEYCSQDANVTYFARNSTDYGDRMTIMCFFEYNTANKSASELCLPPLLVQQIAYVLSPVDDEVLVNDPDVCGHYFYPYEVLQQYVSKFGNFYVNNFDVKWHPQSYAANANHYPLLDYTEVVTSTRKQNEYAFVGPFPFARIVAKDDLPRADGEL